MPEDSNTIHLRLSPAQLLHREALLLRERDEIPESAVPLPDFTLHFDQRQVEPEFVKTMLRGFAYLIGGALHARADGSPGFVALMRFATRGAGSSLSFYCAQPWVIELLRKQKEGGSSEMAAHIGDISVRLKAALLPDTWTPLVFVFDRAEANMLVTNENQIGAPGQFLAPDRGGSSSGLLNAIGTLCLLNEGDPADLKSALERMVADALAATHSANEEWLRWVYYLIDERVFFDPARILVDAANPERFYYDYNVDGV